MRSLATSRHVASHLTLESPIEGPLDWGGAATSGSGCSCRLAIEDPTVPSTQRIANGELTTLELKRPTGKLHAPSFQELRGGVP